MLKLNFNNQGCSDLGDNGIDDHLKLSPTSAINIEIAVTTLYSDHIY